MTTRTTLALVALVAMTSTTGCYSSWDVTPRGLQVLNGFQAGQKRSVMAVDGEIIEFNRSTRIVFYGNDSSETRATFDTIELQGDQFRGIDGVRGTPVQIDLTRVQSIEVEKLSATKSAVFGTIGTICIGIPAVVAIASLASLL